MTKDLTKFPGCIIVGDRIMCRTCGANAEIEGCLCAARDPQTGRFLSSDEMDRGQAPTLATAIHGPETPRSVAINQCRICGADLSRTVSVGTREQHRNHQAICLLCYERK
jgi:hypothetical protein